MSVVKFSYAIKYFRSMLDVRRKDIFLGGKASSPLNRVFHDSSEGVYNWIFISYMYRASSSLETHADKSFEKVF